MKLVICILLVLCATAQACESQDCEAVKPAAQWAAIGAGTAFGFGVGQGIENRYHPTGLVFTIADAVGWGALFLGFGDCEPNSSCSGQATMHDIGIITLALSRVLQVGELFYYGGHHGLFGGTAQPDKPTTGIILDPSNDGRSVLAKLVVDF